jgi:WhiB family redox-sensing transcriptional regulator
MSTDWMELAACTAHDPEMWFPKKVGVGARKEAEVAQRICQKCPVQKACEKYAKDHRIPFGVWGGVYRRKAAIASVKPPADHGTDSGYRRHMRLREPACDRCRTAHSFAWSEYMKRRRA